MDEILKIDENNRNVLGGVTNDVSELIKNLRVNPTNGRLLVDANVTSTNTSIGSTIPGGTAGSILFLGLGSTLAQDNANLFYDDTNNFVGFGNNTPSATLDITGTFQYQDGSETNGYVLTCDANGNATWAPAGGGGGGITSINADTTAAQILSNAGYVIITDIAGGTHTFEVDVVGLAGDATFIATLEPNLSLQNIGGLLDLSTQVTGLLDSSHIDITQLEGDLDLGNIAGQIDLSTQVTGLLSPSNIDVVALANDATFISNLEPNLDLGNLGGLLDLSTQVTGVLPLINGGTQTALTDPNDNRIYMWDDTDNASVFADIGAGLSYDHASHTLSAAGNVLNVTLFEDFINDSSIPEGGSGSNTVEKRFLYASALGDSSGSVPITTSSETNHPGIVSFSDETDNTHLVVFGYDSGTGGGIPLDNDFELEILTRNVYNNVASTHKTTYTLNSAGQFVDFTVNAASGTNALTYNLFSVAGSTTIPASNTWFTAKFTYIAGTLSFYINGVLINSEVGTFGVQTGGYLDIACTELSTGSIVTSQDYVKLNYTVTR